MDFGIGGRAASLATLGMAAAILAPSPLASPVYAAVWRADGTQKVFSVEIAGGQASQDHYSPLRQINRDALVPLRLATRAAPAE